MDTLTFQQVDVLNAIREATEERDKHQQRITSLVLSARDFGCSWSSIGHVLGTSKQWAWKQYGQLTPSDVEDWAAV